jgi:hypothetical protein
MRETEKLDGLLTQVNCRIMSIARLKDAGEPVAGIAKACRTNAIVCSRLAGALPDDNSRQTFAALARTWLELATELEISESLLNACSTVSKRKVEQQLRVAVEFRTQLMRQIDCQGSAFDG